MDLVAQFQMLDDAVTILHGKGLTVVEIAATLDSRGLRIRRPDPALPRPAHIAPNSLRVNR